MWGGEYDGMAEGVGVLTLLPVTSPAFPFLLYIFPTPSVYSYIPPQDPLVLGIPRS